MSSENAVMCSHYETLRRFLHDLAQPLATMTGLVDLLLLEMDEQDKLFQEVQLINEQLEKVMTIIADIRQIVRNAESESLKLPSSTPS